MHPSRGLPLTVLALLGAGCGDAGEAEPPARVRLWQVPSARLTESDQRGEPTPVFTSDFTALGSWRPQPAPLSDGLPEVRLASEDGKPFVRLEGEVGGLQLAVPVQPDTCYEFSGSVRVSSPVTVPRRFSGATFWLGESASQRPFDEHLGAEGPDFERWHVLPTAVGFEGWQVRTKAFVTGPDTHVLHVVCSLSSALAFPGGIVDFRSLELVTFARETFALRALRAAQARRLASDPPEASWQAARRLGVAVGLEFRPGFVLLPGDRLRFPVPRGEGAWTLSFQAAPWRPGLVDERAFSAELGLSVEGTRTLQRLTAPARGDAELTWRPLELALAAGARELEFTLEGDGPVAIGTPELVRALPRAAGPNFILVSIDTLRADHVGARAGGSLTPNLDRLAARGLVAREACAVAPYTLPTHTTLLTGQLPSVHGVVAHERTLSAARSTTLAERLVQAGYVTRAFTGGGFVNPEFGLDRGFDAFATVDPIREPGSHYARTLAKRIGEAPAAVALEAQGFPGVLRWLEKARDERFFLFLHTYTVHDYDAPERYLACRAGGCREGAVSLRAHTEEEAEALPGRRREHVRHLYQAALRYTDERLGLLLGELERLGLAENTVLAVTSDHGEEFFEHGLLQHGRTLYEELLRIPFVLVGPGVPQRELLRPVMQSDMVPTVLALLGCPPLANVQGVDLLGAEWAARPIWAEVDQRSAHLYALRSEDGRKTLFAPRSPRQMRPRTWEFYDLARDPAEQDDLGPSGEWEEQRRALQRELERLEALGASLGAAGSGAPDEETRDELSGLGYGEGD